MRILLFITIATASAFSLHAAPGHRRVQMKRRPPIMVEAVEEARAAAETAAAEAAAEEEVAQATEAASLEVRGAEPLATGATSGR